MRRDSGPFNNYSPAELQGLIEDLRRFRHAYVPHLNATLPGVFRGGPVNYSEERTRVLQLAVRAERAVAVSGIRVGVAPPPVAVGKSPIIGLAGVAFAHEDPTYRTPIDPLLYPEPLKQSYELALDTVDSAETLLTRTFEEERARRRRPTYWVDRVLTAILGFPAYLLSLVFGFDRRALSPASARVLWLLSVTADVAGLYALGNAFGWW